MSFKKNEIKKAASCETASKNITLKN